MGRWLELMAVLILAICGIVIAVSMRDDVGPVGHGRRMAVQGMYFGYFCAHRGHAAAECEREIRAVFK